MARKFTYKDLSAELDKVMADLEDGELDIDAAVSRYERGIAIVKELEKHLKTAENKVKEIQTTVLEDSAEN